MPRLPVFRPALPLVIFAVWALPLVASEEAALGAPLVKRIVERLDRDFDPVTGTFRGAPPLPPHGVLRFLLTDRVRAAAPGAVPLATATLEALARGGIHDQVGGGFHHAAAGAGWRVPRFEKLLGDNALLLRAYALAYVANGNLLFRDVAKETSAWAIREMRDSTGAFWTGLGARGEGGEGEYYIWTEGEIVRTLGPARAEELLAVYRLEPPGVLNLVGSPFAGLGPSREVLLVRRARRVRPSIDEKVEAGSNGLMVGALATSGSLLKRGSDLESARRAATAVLDRLGPPATLKHYAVGAEAFGAAPLEGYAYLAEGLLDLHEATGEPRWRSAAGALVDAAVLRFWDERGGGFREPKVGEGTVGAGPKTARDADLPSANGILASVLLRLGRLTGDGRYAHLGRRTVEAFRAEAEQDSRGMETLAAAAVALDAATPAPGVR